MKFRLGKQSLGYYRDYKCRCVAAQKVGLKRGLRFLEVGSGSGRDLLWYSSFGVHCTAVEISSESCVRIKELFRQENLSKVIVVVRGDAENLPFRDDIFDAVLCKAVLHHLHNPIRAVSEMHRVVKRHGKVAAIDEPNALNPFWHITKFIIQFLHIESFLFSAYRWIKRGHGRGAREDFDICFSPSELGDYFRKANFRNVEIGKLWLPYVIYVNPHDDYSKMLFGIWLLLEKAIEKTPIPYAFGQLFVLGIK